MKNNKEGNKKINIKTILPSALAAILLFVLVWTYFVYIPQKAKNTDANNDSKYELLNPARKFVNQKDLIVNIQPLRDELNKFEGSQDISIYFEYLPTGANISVNKDAEFWPASLLKVPVAMAVAKKIEKGEWKWSNKLVLLASDKDEQFGTLYQEPTGSTHTIEELVRRVLVDSDNTANFILVRNLEEREIMSVYEHIGLKDFFYASGNIGAKKYSTIFRALYNSSFLTEENSQKILSHLSETKFNNYIQSGLPPDVSFAHKIGTGSEREVYLDSGIVYLKNRPYILTVMVKSKDEQAAIEKMKQISERAYDYVANYNENEK